MATVAGLTLFIALIMREGLHDIVSVLSIAGWSLIAVAAFRVVPLFLDNFGWNSLIAEKNHLSLFSLLRARWVAESFNTLLPVAQVGGHIIRARMLTAHKVSATASAATVMVDFTIGTATQFLFIAIGIVLLGNLEQGGGDTTGPLAGIAIAFLLLLGFYMMQRIGFFSSASKFLHKIMPGRKVSTLLEGAENLDQHITGLYQQRRKIFVCSCLRLLAWVSKSGEVALALYLLGAPVTFGKAAIIESLSTAVASAVFFIPGALGVREGGILILGNLLGIPSDVSLALALIKRGREIIVGVPGLLFWMFVEGRILRKKSARGIP